MNTFIKKMLPVMLLCCICIIVDAWADKGFGKKSKIKTALNISIPANVKSSISFNLKSGLSYKGTLLSTAKTSGSNTMVNTSILTYQKGNTTYIVPYKNKITVPEIKQGYTGMKIIIRKK